MLENKIVKCFLFCIVSTLFFIVFFKLWEFNIIKPYVYRGKDDFFYDVVAKNAMEGNSYFLNLSLASPYGMELYYFPLLMQTYILWCKVIGLFTDNWVIAVNLYLFMTYIASAATYFYMCKRCRICNDKVAYVGAMVFSFSQYHLYRSMGHITASSYFVVPLIIVLCYNLSIERYEKEYSSKCVAEIVFICVLVGCTDIYYAFFGCFLLCIMLVESAIKKNWKSFVTGIGMIACIVLVILICLSPSVIYSLRNGANEYAAARTPFDAYWAGFNLTSLFVPLADSRGIGSKFTHLYMGVSALPAGEQICNYIGIIGIIGLIYTAYYVFFKTIDRNKKWFFFVRLNIAVIFLGTVGGIGLLVAFFITDKIRTYTRIFPYVFAFLIIGVCLLFERLCKKNKGWFWLLLILTVVHFLDLSSWTILPDYKATAQRYDEDKKFVSGIESFVNDGDHILQLPYVTGLENYINGIVDNCNYHFKGYLLESKDIGWSYGTLIGTDADDAYKEKFDTDSVEQILFFAKQLGYSGIYVDLSMLEESRRHIIQDLQEQLGYVSVMSENGELFYFDITGYSEYKYTDPVFIYGRGFYGEERDGDKTWRWSEEESEIKVYCVGNIKPVNIKIELHSYHENMELEIRTGSLISTYNITNGAEIIDVPVEFVDNEAVISFKGDSMEYENGISGRQLSFRINNIIIE